MKPKVRPSAQGYYSDKKVKTINNEDRTKVRSSQTTCDLNIFLYSNDSKIKNQDRYTFFEAWLLVFKGSSTFDHNPWLDLEPKITDI